MKRKVLLFSIAFASCMTGLYAENGIDKDKESNRTEKTTGKNAPQKSRLTLGKRKIIKMPKVMDSSIFLM